MAQSIIELIQNENKYVEFTVKNKRTGAAIPLTTATATLQVYNTNETIITKDDDDFVKTDEDEGIIKVLCEFEDSGTFDGLLTLDFGSGVRLKGLFGIEVKPASPPV